MRHWQSELARRAGDIGDLHRALCRDLAPWLDEPAREAMREHLLRAMYSQVSAKRGMADDAYAGVLAHDPLPAALEESVRAERALFVAADVSDLLVGGLHSSVSTSDGEVVYGYKHIPLTMITRQFGTGRSTLSAINARDLRRWRRHAGPAPAPARSRAGRAGRWT